MYALRRRRNLHSVVCYSSDLASLRSKPILSMLLFLKRCLHIATGGYPRGKWILFLSNISGTLSHSIVSQSDGLLLGLRAQLTCKPMSTEIKFDHRERSSTIVIVPDKV